MAQDIFSQAATDTLDQLLGGSQSGSSGASGLQAGDPVEAIYQVAQERGINPEHLLGLARLETRTGQKTVRGSGDDTRNLFNIKDFSGNGGIRARDRLEGSSDAYRRYGSYRESADDLVSLLERKYPGALEAQTPEDFALALKRGGYATDPAYVDKLSRTIRSIRGAADQNPGQTQEWDQSRRYIPMGRTVGDVEQVKPEEGSDGWLMRGWEKSKANAGLTSSLAGDTPEQTAERVAAADRYNQANRGSREKQELGKAWEGGDGILGGLKAVGGEIAKDYREGGGFAGGLVATARNAKALAEGTVEQLPNSVFPMLGMGAGAAAGSLAGPVGTVAGGFAGGAAGNAMIEGGGMLLEAIQKAGINPQDKQAVAQFVKENGDKILGQAAIKGGVISAVDMATLKMGSKLLNGPTDKAVSAALKDMGIDTADKAAVKKALKTPAIKAAVQAKVAADPAVQAANKGWNKAARNTGAALLEPAGEFAGELAGTGLATGEWDTKNAALEAFSSVGQSAGTFAAQKAWQAVKNPSIKAAQQSGGIVSRAGLAATPGAQPPAQPGANPSTPPNPGTPPAGGPTGANGAQPPAQPGAGQQAPGQPSAGQPVTGTNPAAPSQAGPRAKQLGSTANPFVGLFDTDEVYGKWSNLRDGSDRDSMRQLMTDVFKLYANANLSPYDPASLKYELQQGYKWFRSASPQQQDAGVAAIFAAAGKQPAVSTPSAKPGQAPAAPANPIQASAQSAIEQALVEDKARRRAAGEVVEDDDEVTDVEVKPASAERDPMLDQAVEFVKQSGKPSINAVQRQFKIGYNRAARLLEDMERDGIVGPLQADGLRQVLKPAAPPAAAPAPQQPASAGFSSPEPNETDSQGQAGKTLAEMDDAELQARLQYITDQAKNNGGWNSMLSAARREVQSEIDARPKPAPQETVGPQGPLVNRNQLGTEQRRSRLGIVKRIQDRKRRAMTGELLLSEVQPDDVFNERTGQPFAFEAAAELEAERRGGEVAKVEGGYVVRMPSNMATAGAGTQGGMVRANAGQGFTAKDALGMVPQAKQEENEQPAPEFTTLKDVYGSTVTVKTSDLNSDDMLLRMFTKDGKPAGKRIHRENLDPTGEQRSQWVKENADNPIFDVITTKNGGTFAAEGAAERELNKRGMGETHEVVPASVVSQNATGFLIRKKPATEPAADKVANSLAGEKINDEWTAFSPQSGTLGIPRAEMPQIKAEHRGAMVNFLKAKGIDGQQETIPSAAIKPTQAEFSPAKVKQAMDYQGGNRSIIVSADGYVVDGHHQWLAAREKGEPIPAIRLDQNIGDVLAALKDMPSAQPERGAKAEPARIVNANGDKLDVLTDQLVKVESEQRNTFKDPKTGQTVVVSTKATADAMANSKQLKGRATVRKATQEELKSGNVSFVGYDEKDPRDRGYVIELSDSGDTYEQRNADRISRAKAADTQEAWDAITAEENADPERHFEGTDALRWAINGRRLDLKPDNGSFAIYPDRQQDDETAATDSQYPLVTHTTKKGKVLRGYIVRGMTKEQVRANIDEYPIPVDGGFFVREKHKDKLPKIEAGEQPAAAPAQTAIKKPTKKQAEKLFSGEALEQAKKKVKPDAGAFKKFKSDGFEAEFQSLLARRQNPDGSPLSDDELDRFVDLRTARNQAIYATENAGGVVDATQPAAAPAQQDGQAGAKAGGFDSAAFDKARSGTIQASRDAGNTHLDQMPAYVETMRGKAIFYVHDPKVTGVIRTVDNNKNVYVDWSDAYSAEKEMASPTQEGKKTVYRSTIGPRDLKDYALAPDKREQGSQDAASQQGITADDVASAEKQVAQMIEARIDGMKAADVQRIAARFLPTVGVKVPVGKAKIKVAMTDASAMSLLGPAGELRIELSDSVRRALEAKMEGRVGVTEQSNASQPQVKPAMLPPGITIRANLQPGSFTVSKDGKVIGGFDLVPGQPPRLNGRHGDAFREELQAAANYRATQEGQEQADSPASSNAIPTNGMTQAEAQQALESGQKLLHDGEEVWVDRVQSGAVDTYVIKLRDPDSPVAMTKGPAGPRGVQWGKQEAARKAVETMGLPQERQPTSATPDDDANENIKRLSELKQDLQALQQRIKDQGRVADDRLLQRERKLADVIKELEQDIQKAKLDQIPAASVPDEVRDKALEAGQARASRIFDWVSKASGVAQVKSAVMDSLMEQGYFDDGAITLANQIVEELRQRSAKANNQPAGREGYDTPIEVDAATLKTIIEQTRGEPLVNKPAKLEAWRDGTSKTNPQTHPIELAFTADGRLDVNDGRHRIALAAERGEKVTAFIDGKDAQRVKDLLEAATTNQAAGPATADADLEAIFDQLDGLTQRTQANGQRAAAAHPQAERIQFVQKHILDILQDLEDSRKVTINC